jgi:competence protein ComFC
VTALLRLLFPPLCLHCQKITGSPRKRLCSDCVELLELLVLEGRCAYCFSAKSCVCIDRPPILKKVAAAFDYYGPAASLVRALKYGNRPYLAKDAAAFMLVQWHKLGWERPSCIVPVPQSFMHGLSRGYNQSLLIAQALGALLECPVENILKRSSCTLSQTGQDAKQRKKLSPDAFLWKKHKDISDQTLLLVDDVMTTGTTLNHCAATLQEGFPAGVYALTFCAS